MSLESLNQIASFENLVFFREVWHQSESGREGKESKRDGDQDVVYASGIDVFCNVGEDAGLRTWRSINTSGSRRNNN